MQDMRANMSDGENVLGEIRVQITSLHALQIVHKRLIWYLINNNFKMLYFSRLIFSVQILVLEDARVL